MATAADYVIAEVEQLVELGQPPARPDPHPRHLRRRHLPRPPTTKKKIERRTVRKS